MENLDPPPPQNQGWENGAFLPFARLHPWFGGRGAKEQTTAYNLRGTVKVNLPRVTTLDYNRSDMLLLKYAVLEYAAW